MVGSWPSSTEDDPLLFFHNTDGDDDPSSYLLYPPGFGPVEDWLVDPMPDVDDSRAQGEEVLGLSEAMSQKISLVKEEPIDEVPGVERAVVLEAPRDEVPGEERAIVLEAPVTPSEVNTDGVVKGEVKSESGESSDSDDDDDDDEESSSSEEESSEDDDVDEKKRNRKGDAELEDGEIGELEAEAFSMSSDDENGGFKGPIKSKNEIEDLPSVPPVNVSLEPHHQIFAVGVVSSIVGCRVIVEGVEKHNPLNEGSILWLTVTRTPLGIVDEIFGPVKNPFYVVRFNSVAEIPAGAVSVGTAVSFASEFAGHVLNLLSLGKKGYDASGANDEEVDEETEFSDDEKEAEYRRSLRQAKRSGSSAAALDAKEMSFNRTRMPVIRSNQNKPHAALSPSPAPQIQGPAAAPPPVQLFGMGPTPQLQIQGPMTGPPPVQPFTVGSPAAAFAMGQLQMQSMAYGGQNLFPNIFWQPGIAALQGMLQNQQIQNQVFPGMLQNQQIQNQVFPGMIQNQQIQNQAFPGFQIPFPHPGNQQPPPAAAVQWESSVPAREKGSGQTTLPRHGGEDVRGAMRNGGRSQRPFGRGRRSFSRGGGRFRGSGRG